MSAKWDWPFVRRSTYDRLWRENFELRGAIRAANAEIQKHRQFMVDVRNGRIDVVAVMDRIQAEAASKSREALK